MESSVDRSAAFRVLRRRSVDLVARESSLSSEKLSLEGSTLLYSSAPLLALLCGSEKRTLEELLLGFRALLLFDIFFFGGTGLDLRLRALCEVVDDVLRLPLRVADEEAGAADAMRDDERLGAFADFAADFLLVLFFVGLLASSSLSFSSSEIDTLFLLLFFPAERD